MGMSSRPGQALPLVKTPVMWLVTITSSCYTLAQLYNNQSGECGAETAQRSLGSAPHQSYEPENQRGPSLFSCASQCSRPAPLLPWAQEEPKHDLNAGCWIILQNLPTLELQVYALIVLDYWGEKLFHAFEKHALRANMSQAQRGIQKNKSPHSKNGDRWY